MMKLPAFLNDIPVGLVTCRIEYLPPPSPTASAPLPPPETAKLYIATLGVLAPYRRCGLASRMLSHVLEAAVGGALIPEPPKDPKALEKEKEKKKTAPTDASKKAVEPLKPRVTLTEAYVHVHSVNEQGKIFYEANGFEVRETLET